MRIELKIDGREDDADKSLWLDNIVDSRGVVSSNVKVSIYDRKDKTLTSVVISASELVQAATLLKRVTSNSHIVRNSNAQ